MPGQPLLNRHQVGGVSRSPDCLFAQQEREPTRGRPAVRGTGTYGGRSGQRVEEQGTWASRTWKHSEAGYGRPVDRRAWTAKTVKRPQQQPAQPQYANYRGAGKFRVGTILQREISQREISQRSLKNAWEISQTISSVIQCMAWWTQKHMVYFANCQNRVEPPQSHPPAGGAVGTSRPTRGGTARSENRCQRTKTAFEPGSGEKTVPMKTHISKLRTVRATSSIPQLKFKVGTNRLTANNSATMPGYRYH